MPVEGGFGTEIRARSAVIGRACSPVTCLQAELYGAVERSEGFFYVCNFSNLLNAMLKIVF